MHCFCSFVSTVAAAVCARPQAFSNCKLSMQLLTPASRSNEEQPLEPCLRIADIPSHFHEDDLVLYFESEKRSGGGEIAKMKYNSTDRGASIVFESPSGEWSPAWQNSRTAESVGHEIYI